MPSNKQPVRMPQVKLRFKWTSFSLGLVSAFLATWVKEHSLPPYLSLTPLVALVNSTTPPYTCERPTYTVRTISFDPLVQHIEDFITLREREHILNLADSHYERSNVMTNEGLAFSEGRTSSSATLPDDDLVVACVAARAAEFQGYLNVTLIESLQAVRYLPGQEYKIHADWFDDELLLGQDTNRESTFFAVLHADCTHCGTEFPALTVDWSTQDPRWCRIADCDSLDSLIVNAIPGSATFWRNLSPDGKGNPALVHAGLPVQNGTKIGLNIWTHEAKWMQ